MHVRMCTKKMHKKHSLWNMFVEIPVVVCLGGVETRVTSVYQLLGVVSCLCMLFMYSSYDDYDVIWAMKSHAVCLRPLAPCLDRLRFCNLHYFWY